MPSLTVPADGATARLDVFLAQSVPHCSRRTAQRIIAAGDVRINGRRARKGQYVVAGDVVDVPDTAAVPAALQPNPDLVVPVLYEDAAVIAIDKPAGMPSHALRSSETQTAANFLLARYPELARVGKSDLEPGIVHRLDTDTSGILLAARSAAAYAALRAQFAAGQVAKEYLALVDGDVVEPGEVRAPIVHDRNPRKMRVASATTPRARPAASAYRPIERFGRATLVRVHIATGVMHQIRVHLASIGHPIVGDRLYGRPADDTAPARHLLHACRVGFTHPESGRPTSITSPLAGDFTAFVETLRQTPRASTGTTREARKPYPKKVDRSA